MQHLIENLDDLLEAKGLWKKGKFEIATKTGPEEVQGQVYGVWGVYKQGGSYSITHIPSGLRAYLAKRSTDAKNIVQALVNAEPKLLKAQTSGEVAQHQAKFKEIISNPSLWMRPGAKQTKPKVAERRAEIEKFLGDNGLFLIGNYYGKAGDFWSDTYKGDKLSMAIALGKIEVLLNRFVVMGARTRWNNVDYKLISKIDEATLLKWIKEVKSSPTMKELRQADREEVHPDEIMKRR